MPVTDAGGTEGILSAPLTELKRTTHRFTKYTTTIKDTQNVTILPGGLIEILQGPAGMMMIHRRVFEKLMKERPDLEIQTHQHKDLFPKDLKIFSFWDCTFKDGMWTGDDIAFCNLARSVDFKLHANIESSLTTASWELKQKIKAIKENTEMDLK